MSLCRCGAELDPEGTSSSLASRDYRHTDSTECPYVSCDDPECCAKVDPQTPDEWRAAAEHWKSHRYLHGCSHGC